VGQYVSRGGKQYYKGDDGKLYANFRDANLSSSPADQAIRGIGQGFGYVGGVLQDVLNAQGGPSWGGRSAAASDRGLVGNPSVAGWAQAPGRPEGTQAILGKKPVQWAIENGEGRWVRDYQNEGDIMREMLAEQAAKRAANQAGSSATLDLRGAPPAPILPAPITSPNTTFQNADDEYNRLKSQFGGTTGVSQLAGMASLPTGFTPTGGKQAAGLKDYYAAQQEVGERNIGAITESLAYKDPRYQKGGKLEQWAKANPMLAMREFNKLGYQTSAEMQSPSDQQKIRAAMSGGTYYPSEGSPSPVTNPPDFGTPANGVPADPRIQGRAVSAPYDAAQAMAAQKTAGATGMPQFQTSQPQPPGKNYLDAFRNAPWSEAFVNTLGGMAIRKLQGL
jgi:hypothetical protein